MLSGRLFREKKLPAALRGIGDGGLDPTQAALNRFGFHAELTKSVVLNRGVGAASYTGATVKTVKDFEGNIRNTLSGEVRFEGQRRVRNLLSGGSESLDTWTKTNAGVGTVPVVTTGQTAPDGTATAYRLEATIPGGIGSNANYSFIDCTTAAAGSLGSVWVKSNTGATQLFYWRLGSTTYVMQATRTWRRLSRLDCVTTGTQASIGTRGGSQTDAGY